MARKSNKNAPYEGSSSFSLRNNDAKELTQMFQSNQLESYNGPKEFLSDPQNSYWKKYDPVSFANGWQRCRYKAMSEPSPEMMEETAELSKCSNMFLLIKLERQFYLQVLFVSCYSETRRAINARRTCREEALS
jgi:hypothetical protein